MRVKSGLQVIRRVRNWPKFMLDFYKFAGRDKLLDHRLRNGAIYRVRAGTWDVRVIAEVCVLDHYTPPGFEVGESDTVIDIGAQIGAFTIHAARAAKRGRVFAYEPNPDNYARLTENVRLNALGNVTAACVAVADDSGRRDMFFHATDTAQHSFYVGGAATTATPVETTTLERIVREEKIDRIDFLKMDCEGAEHEILAATSDELIGRVAKVSMECHTIADGRDPESLRRYFESRGFTVSLNAGLLQAKRP